MAHPVDTDNRIESVGETGTFCRHKLAWHSNTRDMSEFSEEENMMLTS